MLTYFYKVEKDCVFYKRYFLVKNERETRKKYEEKFLKENNFREDLNCYFCKHGKNIELFIDFNESECEINIKHIRKKSLNSNLKEIKPSSALFKSYWNMVVKYVDFEMIWQFDQNPLPFCEKFYSSDLYFQAFDVDGELYAEAEHWYHNLPDCFIMMQPPEDKRIWDNLFAYTGIPTFVITA